MKAFCGFFRSYKRSRNLSLLDLRLEWSNYRESNDQFKNCFKELQSLHLSLTNVESASINDKGTLALEFPVTELVESLPSLRKINIRATVHEQIVAIEPTSSASSTAKSSSPMLLQEMILQSPLFNPSTEFFFWLAKACPDLTKLSVSGTNQFPTLSYLLPIINTFPNLTALDIQDCMPCYTGGTVTPPLYLPQLTRTKLREEPFKVVITL
jgi:hypothetical protein